MTRPRGDSATVFVDADNTLWETDAVFAEAQLNLLAAVEEAMRTRARVDDRLGYVRDIDQGIAERHHSGLRYPPKLLIRAAASALGGEAPDRAARLALTGSAKAVLGEDVAAAIEGRYFEDLARAPALRPGVLEGLAILQNAGATVLIVTEGARAKVECTADRLGLAGHFTRIIEGAKRPDLFRRVLRLTGAPPRAFMVGDQLDRDIVPAKEAGAGTIYFPGGFKPRWHPTAEEVVPDHVVTTFLDVPRIVLSARQ